MAYVSGFERRATERGLEKGLLQGLQQELQLEAVRSVIDILESRFGQVPSVFSERLEQLESTERVRTLRLLAVNIPSLSDFERELV